MKYGENMTECNEERKAIDIFGNECSDYFGSGAYSCSDCLLYEYCIGSSDNGDYDDECVATFDEYRCKGCWFYSSCLQNEHNAEAEWEMQQQFIKGELKWINTDTLSESEIISDGDVPF